MERGCAATHEHRAKETLGEKGMTSFEGSLLAALTNAENGPRLHPLSDNCGVICLSRVIRSLNKTPAETLDELYTRRETAALLAELRHKISREASNVL
jgi:hypothetical protein